MMDGIKNGVGGRVVVVEDDMGDGMLCVNHPYRNNPGGICAFCLQEKLGKLVSSSFPLPIRASSTSSASSPPFRSETTNAAVSGGGVGGIVGSTSSMSLVRPMSNEECYTRKATRIPFLLAKKKKITAASSSDYHHHHHHGYGHGGGNIAFKRSKSTSAQIRGRFLDGGNGGDFSPRKRSGFWSFLYLSSTTHSSKKLDKVAASSVAPPPPPVTTTATGGASSSSSGYIVQKRKPKEKSLVIIEDDDSPNNNETTPSAASSTTSFERKVSRSRSVGCGSRSFSGDFFERISTGLGDCTLRRVESQREGKPKSTTSSASGATVAASTMKERVKCGGIFGGFIITSSSSSSSSSSYWLSSSAEDHHNVNGRSNKSWGWALTSPMRAFTKPSSGKKDSTAVIRESNNKNTSSTTTPNLAAIPSLLTVRV